MEEQGSGRRKGGDSEIGGRGDGDLFGGCFGGVLGENAEKLKGNCFFLGRKVSYWVN